METLIVIVIIAIASAYTARTYWRKLKPPKTPDGDTACTSCGCGSTCAQQGPAANHNPGCDIEKA
ncbi:MAG: FeoB-associated Cys-rich membrane protein [Desulfobacterales bacterium]|nr:FeoB-associated Cys-rich membrane protein [Desulfobacterales bacterium]